MTGHDAAEIVAVQRRAAVALRKRGIEPLDPAKKEGVKPGDGMIHAEADSLRQFWRDDKDLIRRAHVVLDLSGPSKSEGVAHEIGFARYFLFHPVVRVWPGLGASIARLDDDVIVENVDEAAAVIRAKWGTPRKRVIWRLRLLVRCLPGYLRTRASFFWDWL